MKNFLRNQIVSSFFGNRRGKSHHEMGTDSFYRYYVVSGNGISNKISKTKYISLKVVKYAQTYRRTQLQQLLHSDTITSYEDLLFGKMLRK